MLFLLRGPGEIPMVVAVWHCPLDRKMRSPRINAMLKQMLSVQRPRLHPTGGNKPFSQVLDKACYSHQMTHVGSPLPHVFHPLSTWHILKPFLTSQANMVLELMWTQKARALPPNFLLLLPLILKTKLVFFTRQYIHIHC